MNAETRIRTDDPIYKDEWVLEKSHDLGNKVLDLMRQFSAIGVRHPRARGAALRLAKLELKESADPVLLKYAIETAKLCFPNEFPAQRQERYRDTRLTRTAIQKVLHGTRDVAAGFVRVPLFPAVFVASFLEADRLIERSNSTENLYAIWEEYVLNMFLGKRTKVAASLPELLSEFVLTGPYSFDKRHFSQTDANAAFSKFLALVALAGYKARVQLGKSYDGVRGIR